VKQGTCDVRCNRVDDKRQEESDCDIATGSMFVELENATYAGICVGGGRLWNATDPTTIGAYYEFCITAASIPLYKTTCYNKIDPPCETILFENFIHGDPPFSLFDVPNDCKIPSSPHD